tara:strand:+ start:32841 stop:34376 length:1536 start_codon:yes stop_codon:yes gene_type:complete
VKDYYLIALYIPFVAMGMRLLRNAFQNLFSKFIHRGIVADSKHGFSAAGTGVLGSLFLFSTSIYNRLILNLLPGRLISIEKAINLSTGSLLGSFLIVLIFLKAHIVAAVILMLLGTLGMIWSKKTKIKLCSQILFAFGLVIWGLSLGQFGSYSQITNINLWYALALGLGLSLILRSSAVALIIGIWTFGEGSSVSPFMFSAGVILGGCLPEIIAANKGNTDSKQVAFFIFCQRIIAFVMAVTFSLWLQDKNGVISKLDVLMFFGFCLIIGVLLTKIFKKLIFKIARRLFPSEEYPEEPKLNSDHIGEETTASIALIQARRQVGKMANILERIFTKVRTYIENDIHPKSLAKIKDYERVTDNMKEEVENFLLVVMERSLTVSETNEIVVLIKLVDELEAIADYLDKLATYRTKFEEEEQFSPQHKKEFLEIYDQVEKYFHDVMSSLLNLEQDERAKLNKRSNKLKSDIDKMRLRQANELKISNASSSLVLTYSDMIIALRKIRGHTRHISNM